MTITEFCEKTKLPKINKNANKKRDFVYTTLKPPFQPLKIIHER
jgi:hypothetical protein